MATRRTYGSYNDGCASAHALDIIGERWALVVVRELLLGPKRFVDIQADIPGIGPGVLSRRLHELEEAGVATRRTLPAPSGATVYELTDWGHELEAVNTALSRWAVGSPGLPVEADMSPDTLVLAMRAHARPAPSGTTLQRVLLVLIDSRADDGRSGSYLAEVGADTVVARAAAETDVDARVEATTRAWKVVILGGRALDEIPGLAITGDVDAVRSLVACTSWQVAPAAG